MVDKLILRVGAVNFLLGVTEFYKVSLILRSDLPESAWLRAIVKFISISLINPYDFTCNPSPSATTCEASGGKLASLGWI